MKSTQRYFTPCAMITAIFTLTACGSQNWQDYTGNNRGYADFNIDSANCQLQAQSAQPATSGMMVDKWIVGVTAVSLIVQVNSTFHLCMQARGWQQAPQQLYYLTQNMSNGGNNGNNYVNNASGNASESNSDSDSNNSNDAADVNRVAYQASQDNPAAQYSLGLMFHKGIGVTQNDAEAVKWFHRAAEHGHSDAQKYLGMSYSQGWGVERNDRESTRWFQKSAEQGNTGAQLLLGVAYHGGIGVRQDGSRGIRILQVAAAKHDKEALLARNQLNAYGGR